MSTTLEQLADEWSVDPDAIVAYCDNHGVSLDEMDKEHFFDSYCGQWDDLEDFAYELVNEILNVSNDWLVENNYIAYDRIARDMRYEGYWISDEGHVFRPI
jgi:antirestriction protein